MNSSKKRNPSRETAKWIAQAASDVHAIDLKVLDLRELTALTDYFVIASGRSDRQVQAICQRIEETMKHRHRHPIGIEGYTKGHWILIDYGEVVAHVFYEEVRNFYALEKLWSDAPITHFRLK
ncbi:MAG: ribosome silencing factor [Deltaproteobacteria bacterium]|nr:ribosome silencing factor [Deltaproteobacteria bacterium]